MSNIVKCILLCLENKLIALTNVLLCSQFEPTYYCSEVCFNITLIEKRLSMLC